MAGEALLHEVERMRGYCGIAMTEIATMPEPGGAFPAIAEFLRETRFDDLPAQVRAMAPLYLLDLIGVANAGHALDAGRIARNYPARHWSAGDGAPAVPLWLNGRPVSLPGFAYALATQIDNLDAHDGWQPCMRRFRIITPWVPGMRWVVRPSAHDCKSNASQCCGMPSELPSITDRAAR